MDYFVIFCHQLCLPRLHVLSCFQEFEKMCIPGDFLMSNQIWYTFSSELCYFREIVTLKEFHDKMLGFLGDFKRMVCDRNRWIFLWFSFIQGWKLTVVILCVGPLLFVTSALMSKVISKMMSNELKAYGTAGAIAEEVFSNVRTVLAYNGSNYEAKRWGKEKEFFFRNEFEKTVPTDTKLFWKMLNSAEFEKALSADWWWEWSGFYFSPFTLW